MDRRETTALLATIAQLGFDKRVRRQAAAATARRFHPLPEWLTRLGESVAYRAVEMVHVLGDGDDVMIGVRLPGGHELTVVVYIDHNMGTIAKDAFVVPKPIAVLDRSDESAPRGAGRHRVAGSQPPGRSGQGGGSHHRWGPGLTPLESESWPMCRPLVEWAVRLLPEGGAVTSDRSGPIEAATGEREVNAIGYCLGGTLLSFDSPPTGGEGDARFQSATYFLTILYFREAGEQCVFIDEEQLKCLRRR